MSFVYYFLLGHSVYVAVILDATCIQGAAKTYPDENCNFLETAEYFSTKFSTFICISNCVH